MIKTILQKCLDNLNFETPDLSYIRGMIEVLLAMEEKPITTQNLPKDFIPKLNGQVKSEQPQDDGALLDAAARANIERIKAIADKSTE